LLSSRTSGWHASEKSVGHPKVFWNVLESSANAESMGVASNVASTQSGFVSAAAEGFAG